MTKIIAAIIGIVLIGALWFIFLGGEDVSNVEEASSVSGESINNDSDSEKTSFEGTLTEIIALGENVKCTIEHRDEMIQTKGTIYVSGENVRGEFNMTSISDGTISNADTLSKDNVSYTWGNTPFGSFATKVDSPEEEKTEESSPVNLGDNVDFKCEKWNVDNSLFTLPPNTTFEDITSKVR